VSDLRHATKYEIIDGLNDRGVTDCFNIKVRDKDGQQHPTITYILTFNSPITPKHIKVGYIGSKLRHIFLTHYAASIVNNMETVRMSAAVCARCGERHSQEQCSNPSKCRNCSSPHPAYSKDCPRWKLEKKVQEVKAKLNMSYIEARHKVEAGENVVPTAAAVISSSLGNTRPATTSPTHMCSIHTQTDITWPLTLN